MDFNDILLLIVSIILITLVALQNSKDSGLSALTGEKSELFKNQKQRGPELFFTQATVVMSVLFFAVSIWAMIY